MNFILISTEFTDKGKDTKTDWNICSFGKRIDNARNQKGDFESKMIDLTNEFHNLFKKYGINDNSNLKEDILNVKEAKFYKEFINLFKLMLQIRNSESNEKVDFLQSPVKNNKGEFFNSNNVNGNEAPENADANGAYNIARKGLWIVNQIKTMPDSQMHKIKLAMKNQEWLLFAQKGNV